MSWDWKFPKQTYYFMYVDIFDFKQRDKIAIDCDVKRKRFFFVIAQTIYHSPFSVEISEKAVLPENKLSKNNWWQIIEC